MEGERERKEGGKGEKYRERGRGREGERDILLTYNMSITK